MTTAATFPIGAVIAYAGNMQSETVTLGWMLCDGSAVSQNTYGTLYTVIQAAYGANPNQDQFSLPDFTGQFLRGVDDSGQNRDPDASRRMQPRTGLQNNGNVAPYVGSIQPSGMVSHTHAYSVCTETTSSYWGQNTQNNAIEEAVDAAAASGAVGRGEFRPVNQYVNFLIKSSYDTSQPNDDADVIVGSVAGYAGDLSDSTTRQQFETQGWLLCDGRGIDTNVYPKLGAAISTYYGTNSAGQNCIPCYFGRFWRGVADNGSRDPDYDNRSPPGAAGMPNLGASSGVGSVQVDAMAAHTHEYSYCSGTHAPPSPDPNVPNPETLVSANVTSAQTSSSGSGTENIPKNIALECVIAADFGNEGALIPSGLVVNYAGSTSSQPGAFDPSSESFCGWLVCDGSSYDTTQLSNLFTAIGYAHGGSGTQFNVPDLRGRFMRAVDHGAAYGLPPVDVSPRSAAATGGNSSGVGSYQADGYAAHTHSFNQQIGSVTCQWYWSSHSGDPGEIKSWATASSVFASPATGLSPSVQPVFTSENRPVNAYSYFLIKA